ncbi:MAG: hypothetical protein GY800_06630 [Planctomycetes bacterium]|nr:hypothetical protein [Planctomycetota bacterium]
MQDLGFLLREAQRIARYRERTKGQATQACGPVSDSRRLKSVMHVVVGLSAHIHGDELGGDATKSLLQRLQAIGREQVEDKEDIFQLFCGVRDLAIE